MRLKNIVFIALCTLLLSACLENNSGYYPDNGGTYRPSSYDRYDSRYDSRYDYDREADRARWERDQLREERERLERERERQEQDQYNRPPPPPVIYQPAPDGCQSGFRLRGSKCSDKERKNGCRDSRSRNGGQYCVSGV